MGKPTIADRLAGLKRCGCTDAELCPQHEQALSRQERRAYRGRRGTGRGRGKTTDTTNQGREEPWTR